MKRWWNNHRLLCYYLSLNDFLLISKYEKSMGPAMLFPIGFIPIVI